MGDEPDFAKQFHNIGGESIKERKRNFFKFLNNSQLSYEQIENQLNQIKPNTYLENLFYIDLLIHYKQTKDLKEILKQGNEIHISKILKQEWFFKSAFEDTDIETFVNEFLPCLSFRIRKKLLGKISKCWAEEKIDLLFDALDKKYGSNSAYPLLYKCTLSKIKIVIEDKELKLLPSHVLYLYKKSIDFFIYYINYFFKSTGKAYAETKVLNYIASKNPELLLSLLKEEKVDIYGLGKRTSKAIVDIVKKDLPKDYAKYLSLVKKSVLIRKLGYNFKPIYKDLFPKNLKHLDSYCYCNTLLKYYPKNGRWNLLLEICNEVYKNNSIEDVLLQFGSLKTFNPPKEIIFKWAEINYQQQDGNYMDYLKYYEPSKAIPIIKDKINVTSNIPDRRKYLTLLVNLCAENKDLKALEEVLKYICFRHRNEESYTRMTLLNEMSSFNLQDFNQNHWKYIDEQIKILKIQKEYNFRNLPNFMERYVEFLIKNDKDFKLVLSELIKDIVDDVYVKKLTLDESPTVQKIYHEMAKLLPSVLDKNTTYRKNLTRFLVMSCEFSTKNPTYVLKISEYPEFVSLAQESFSKTEEFDGEDKKIIPTVIKYNMTFPDYAFPSNGNLLTLIKRIVKEEEILWLWDSVISLVVKKDRNAEENEILSIYFNNYFEKCPLKEVTAWFLENEPDYLSPYYSKVAKAALDNSCILNCKLVKQYSHLGYDKITRERFLEQVLSDGLKMYEKKCLVEPLGDLLPTEDLTELVDKHFLPKKDKLDVDDDTLKELYDMQVELLKVLSKSVEPFKIIPTVMKFCRGDFLQHALRPLYSAFYRSPEKILYSYAQTLSKQAVSVRKHALFLSCVVLDKEHVLNLLNNADEKNVSIQKHQISSTMKYFSQNPSSDLLEKIIQSFDKIDVNDEETLDTLKDFQVPSKYRSKYVESCWGFFDGIESKGVKNNDYLDKLLGTMREKGILESLSHQFLVNILTKYFPLSKNRLRKIDSFAINILQFRVSERGEFFPIVFDLLSKLSKKIVDQFFEEFSSLSLDTLDEDFLQTFDSNWNKHFAEADRFDNIITLKLIISRRQGVQAWAVFIVNYLEQLIEQFGFHAYTHFSDIFRQVLSSTTNDVEKNTTFLEILKFKTTTNTCMLVLDHLRRVEEDDEKFNIYKDIIDILKNVDIPIVRFNYEYFMIYKCD